jgi:hypothetical protein
MQFCKLPQPVNSPEFDVTCHATCRNNDANASAHISALRGRRFGTAVPNGEAIKLRVEWRNFC